MDAAVAQLTVVQVCLLCTLTCQLRHACHCLALALALLHLVLNGLCHFAMYVQVVVDLRLDEVAHILIDGLPTRCHLRRAQLNLRLTLEHRLLHVDGDGGDDTVSDVAILVLAEELLDGAGNVLLECTLVGAALDGVLTVDERIVLLTILVGMRQRNLDVLALQVDNGIERVVGHAILQQILQTIARKDAATVVHDGQTGVQIGVVAEHVFHDIVVERVVLEQRVVGFEEDVGARFVLRGLRLVAFQNAPFENSRSDLSVTIGAHLEARAQEVHRLDAHAIHAHRLLERLRVVLTTRVQLAHGFHEFALWNAATVVANGDAQVVVDVDLDALAGIHAELVDGVVDGFLQQHIDAVLGMRSVVEATDVHTRASANMVYVREMANLVISILYVCRVIDNGFVFFCHLNISMKFRKLNFPRV